MEKRLVPVNALISLVTPGGFEHPVLANAGYYAAALESGAATPHGTVTIDVVIASNSNTHLLACESKSGSNIEDDQAKKYAALDGPMIVQAALITMRERVTPQAEILYACLREHSDRILRGLGSLELNFPLLAVSAHEIRLENSQYASTPLGEALAEPVRVRTRIPQFIPFDHESPNEVIEPHVRAVLVASLTRRLPLISLATLTEQAMPHYTLYSRQVQVRIRNKVGQVARGIAQKDPDTFEYHGPPPNRDGWVRFLRTPEDNDPRGRTQAYQAMARRSRVGRPVAGRTPGEGQLDLLKELDRADDVGEDVSGAAQEGGDQP